MTHTIREKKKLLARVGRIRGQIEAIERALNDEAGCERIMHMIAGVRGGVAGLMAISSTPTRIRERSTPRRRISSSKWSTPISSEGHHDRQQRRSGSLS
jgi:hypothetical protein